MKSCGIHNISDPILNELMAKYGAVDGFKTYVKTKREMQLDDTSIRRIYLKENLRGESQVGKKIRPAMEVKSFNGTTASIETEFGVNKLKVQEGTPTTYYKPLSDKAAAKKVVEINKALGERGLADTYTARRYKSAAGIIVKVLPHNRNLEQTKRLVPEASAPFVKLQEEKLRVLNQEKRNLQTDMEGADTISPAYFKMSERLDTVNREIKQAQSKKRELRELDTVTKLFNEAEADYKWLQEFFSKPDFTFDELQQAIIKYETWAVSTVSPGKSHPYLDELEQGNKELVNKMNAISTRVASRFGAIMSTRIQEAVIASTRKHSKNLDKLSDQDILDTLVEEGVIPLQTARAYTLNLGKQTPIILQSLFNNVNKANNDAHNAAYDRIQLIKEAAKGIRPKDQRSFYQRDAQGRLTGELVQPMNAEFISEYRRLTNSINYALIELSALDPDSKEYAAAFKVLTKARQEQSDLFRKNVAPINIAHIVGDMSQYIAILPEGFLTESVVDKEMVTNLEKRFGKAQANRMLKQAKALAYSFTAERDAIITELLANQAEEGGSSTELSPESIKALTDWNNQNSPFVAYKISQGAETTITPSYKFTLPVPNENAVDKNFDAMVKNFPEVLHFYNVMVDIMEEGRAEIGDISGYLTGLSIPLMREGFFKEMFQGGLHLPKLMDSLKEAISVQNQEIYQQENLHQDVDGIVNTKQINMNAVTMHGIQKQVKEELLRLQQDFVDQNGEEALTKEVKAELRKDAIDNVYTKSSSNLVGIVSMLALNIQTIKAKRAIEPQIKLVSSFMKNGELLNGKFDQNNAVKAMEYFLDKEFYGISPIEKIGKGGTKVLTAEQREALDRLEEEAVEIDNRIFELEGKENRGEILSQPEQAELEAAKKRREALEKEAENIGRNLKGSKVLDGAISLTQLIGIGFSPITAVGNVGIGYIANQIRAAEGRDYDGMSLGKAYSYLMGNTARFWTFGLSKRALSSKHGDKIRTLIDRNQMVSSIFDEIHHNTSKLTGKNKGAFRASHLMERSEFINQAAIMVAMMLDTEVKLKDGTIITLYDAYNADGDINPDVVSYRTKGKEDFAEWNSSEFFQYVKHIVEEVHGDYNHSVMLKKFAAGRLVSTFRTWMYRTYSDRYSPEHYDSIAGYTRKGKYLSASPFVRHIPLIGKFVPPLVIAGTGLDKFAGSLVPKNVRKKIGLPEQSVGTTELLSGLGKALTASVGVYGDFFKALVKPTRYKSRFKESLDERGYSEVDAANISSVFSEWFIRTQLALISLLLYSLYDDDDDNETKKSAIILALNLSRRFEADLNLYSDPRESGRTLDQPIPALRLSKNLDRMSDAVSRAFDDTRDPYLQSGFYEGWWAPTKAAFRSLPGLTAVDQARRYMNIDVMTGNNITDKEDLYDAFEKSFLISPGEPD